jgi:hypothetical protein
VDRPAAVVPGSVVAIVDFCEVPDALRLMSRETSGSLLALVGVSKLAFRGGCIDLIGLILMPGLPLGPKSAVEGAGEDDVLIEDSLDVVCLERRPARELRDRGCCGRSGSSAGIAGTSGMEPLRPIMTASASAWMVSTGPEPEPEPDVRQESRFTRTSPSASSSRDEPAA